MNNVLSIISSLLEIGGSLGLFLYGMKIMSDGLQKAAGERMHSIMNLMTSNRIMAIFTGFIITCLVQSSSATTVMVVSFANAGLLSLIQSIGVIMGANIGTTITGWIVSLLGFKFSISVVALPAIGAGIVMLFSSKKSNVSNWGEAIIGFGLLFLGLDFLKDATPNIGPESPVVQYLAHISEWGYFSVLIFALAGMLLTAVVQSSSAAMAITLTLAFKGIIDFPMAASIAVGSNIGTTITAALASIGANKNAMRASLAHFLFNTLGSLWVIILIVPFTHLVSFIVTGSTVAAADESVGTITIKIALFHTMFNIANTLIFVGIIPQFAKIIERIIPMTDEEVEPTNYELKYITTNIQDTPEMNVLKAKIELSKMSDITEKMFTRFINVFTNPNTNMGEAVEKQIAREDYTDQMQEQISSYLIACSKENLNAQSHINVNAMIRIANELESMADSCCDLVILSKKRYERDINLSEAAYNEITEFCKIVKSSINLITENLNTHMDRETFALANEFELKINETRDMIRKATRARVQTGENVKAELMVLDFVKHIEHIGDYCLNIAGELRTIR